MKLVIQFYADVTEITTNALLDFINGNVFAAKKSGQKIEELIIQVASYGGLADRGILVYNTLRQLGIPIKTIGMSNVDSAAISIFCAGDKRYAMRSCRFLIHESRIPSASELDDSRLDELSKLNRILNSESARIVAKTCSNKKAKIQGIRQLMRKSIVWDATEAKRTSLIHDMADGKIFYDINAEDIKLRFITNPQSEGLMSQSKK